MHRPSGGLVRNIPGEEDTSQKFIRAIPGGGLLYILYINYLYNIYKIKIRRQSSEKPGGLASSGEGVLEESKGDHKSVEVT